MNPKNLRPRGEIFPEGYRKIRAYDTFYNSMTVLVVLNWSLLKAATSCYSFSQNVKKGKTQIIEKIPRL